MRKLVNYIKNNQVSTILFLLIFGFIFFMSIRTQTDFDYWFHYAAGEYFVKTGKVPQIPIGSWWALEEGLEWISHEWAFGVVIYWLTHLIGEKGLVIFSSLMIALVGALAFGFKIEEWRKRPLLAVVGIILMALVLQAYAVPRPQLFLYLFTVGLFALLLHERDYKDNWIWMLCPLTILWTNFHGGSYILIFVFFVVLILSECFDLTLGKIEFKKAPWAVTQKRLRVLIISFALVALNGHGLNMYYYPISNWTDTVMIENISEWKSADIKNSFDLTAMVLPCLFLCALIGTKKKIKGFDMVCGWAMIYLSLQSIRFFAQADLLMIMLIPYYFDSLDIIEVPINQDRLKYALLLCLMFVGIGSVPLALDAMDEPFNMDVFPSDNLIEEIKELQPERLFNTYNTGGYLVYKGVDVFIDGRADIYSRYNMSDYVRMEAFALATDELMAKYNFDYLLIQKDTRLQQWMDAQNAVIERYELLYEEGTYRLYKNLNYVEGSGMIEVEELENNSATETTNEIASDTTN